MLKSELEKAAKDYSDREMGSHAMRFFDSPEFVETPLVKAFRDGARWALGYVKEETKKDMLEVYGPQVISCRGGAWAIMLGDLGKILQVKDETETKEK